VHRASPRSAKAQARSLIKSECPALETYSVKTSKLPPTMETNWSPVHGG
jgi:hypothetical protein